MTNVSTSSLQPRRKYASPSWASYSKKTCLLRSRVGLRVRLSMPMSLTDSLKSIWTFSGKDGRKDGAWCDDEETPSAFTPRAHPGGRAILHHTSNLINNGNPAVKLPLNTTATCSAFPYILNTTKTGYFNPQGTYAHGQSHRRQHS